MADIYKNLQEIIIKTMKIADPSGKNAEIMEDLFKNTSEAQFKKMLQNPEFKLIFQMEEFDHEPQYHAIIEAADSIGAVYQERMIMDRKTGQLSEYKYPSLLLPVPRLQQKGDTVNISASSSTRRNSMGQVDGEDKGAQISDNETMGLLSSKRVKTVEEMYKIRSGTEKAKQEFYNELQTTGSATIDDKVIDKEDRKEVNVVKSAYLGMGLHVDM